MLGELSRRSFVAGVGGALCVGALAPLAARIAQAQGIEAFVPGVYEGSAQGMYGPITVEVTVDESAIVLVEVTEYHDTSLVVNAAIADVPNKIVDEQSLGVDVAAGATMSSYGIIGAVEDAVAKAGADVKALGESPVSSEREDLPDEEFDIVVVGAGGAGMAAAIQARRTSDCSVVLLEKESYCGGSTALSGGQISVGGTEKNGVGNALDFNADEYLEFFKKRAGEMDRRPDGMWINETLVHRIGERAPEFYGYLLEEGIDQPYATVCAKFDEEGRGITGFKNKETRGQVAFGVFMKELVEKNGAEIRTNARVTNLVIEDGAVAGVQVETPTSTYTIRAKKVILTSGGFARNRELFEEQNSYYKNINMVWPYTAPGTTGDAFAFCADLDPAYTGYGFIVMGGCVEPYGFESPQGAYPTSGLNLWVNQQGKRFVDEGDYYYRKTFAIAELEEGYCYAVTSAVQSGGDDVDMWSFGDLTLDEIAAQLGARGGAWVDDTLEGLAEQTGMDIENLKASIEEDRERCAAGAVDSFGLELYPAVGDAGPYYAFKILPTVICTMYGFKLDDDFRVLNNAGEPIPNLFAAGELTMGNYFFQEYVATSCAVACSVYGGSIAAEEAIAEMGA